MLLRLGGGQPWDVDDTIVVQNEDGPDSDLGADDDDEDRGDASGAGAAEAGREPVQGPEQAGHLGALSDGS